MQHNSIVSIGRKCFTRNDAFQAVFPGSCRQFSYRPHMKSSISPSSIPAHQSPFCNAHAFTTQSTKTIRPRQKDRVLSGVCTTLTAPNPASSKSFCTSSLGAGLARRQHISSLGNNHFHQPYTLSSQYRRLRHYTKSRSYTSKLFYDKNGSAIGVKAAGTRVLLLIGSVLVAWFVLNYAIGAAIMMVLKGIWKLVWGSLCWLVWGVYGVLKAIVGL